MTGKVIPYPTTQIKPEQVCSICLNGFTAPDPTPDQQPVTHTQSDGSSPMPHDPFHKGCLKEWAKNNPIYPIDRTPLDPPAYPFISRFILPGVAVLASMATGAVINRFIANPTMLPTHALIMGALSGLSLDYRDPHLDLKYLVFSKILICTIVACAPDLFCKISSPYLVNLFNSWAGRDPPFNQSVVDDKCTTMQSPLPYICGALASWATGALLRRFLWS